jgi:hypothetical protein
VQVIQVKQNGHIPVAVFISTNQLRKVYTMSDEILEHTSMLARKGILAMLKEMKTDGTSGQITAANAMLLIATEALGILNTAASIEIERIIEDKELTEEEKSEILESVVADMHGSIAMMVERLPKVKTIFPDRTDNVVPFNKGELH